MKLLFYNKWNKIKNNNKHNHFIKYIINTK